MNPPEPTNPMHDDTEAQRDRDDARPIDNSLHARWDAAIEDAVDEYTHGPAHRPWLVGYSGGKDSTLALQIVVEAMLQVRPSRRTRPVHVVCNDTLVESPIVQAHVDAALVRIAAAAEPLRVPLTVAKTTPPADNGFWANLIGRGYRAPTRLFRWCTDRMKIRPTSQYIREHIGAAGEVVLVLGVRRDESANRAKTIAKYDGGGRLNPHNDLAGCWIYRPVVDFTTEEVWTLLLQRRPPWGGTHRALVTLYRNALAGECPFVVDADDAPSCGENPSSRFGCWTCTVVTKDRSLQGFVAAGFEHLEPLVAFRDELVALSEDHANRMGETRRGDEGPGPFTMEVRAALLEKLLALQVEVGVPLIRPAEVEAIRAIWAQDESTAVQRQAGRLLTIYKGE